VAKQYCNERRLHRAALASQFSELNQNAPFVQNKIYNVMKSVPVFLILHTLQGMSDIFTAS
jgi:hypothetical protein